MHAKVGDWLVVSSGAHGHTEHRGQIIALHNDDGTPPYDVHWLEDDHESLVFPGPDAMIVTAEQQVERDRVEAERVAAVQAEIARG